MVARGKTMNLDLVQRTFRGLCWRNGAVGEMGLNGRPALSRTGVYPQLAGGADLDEEFAKVVALQ